MTQQEMILHKKRFGQYFSGKTVADMLFSLLPEKHEWVNVVDPMAGIGDMLVAVRENAKKCSTMFGVEIDEEVSRECAEHVPEARVIHGDAFTTGDIVTPEGFDLVITNPPYVRYQLQGGNDEVMPSAQEIRENLIVQLGRISYLSDEEKVLFLRLAENYSGLSDMAVPAWLLCAALVKKDGYLAMVVPETWLSRDYAAPIQYLLLKCFRVETVAIIFSAVMGFDIDPLAVMLAKVNWIMAMRDLFPAHCGSITVPIYHADSLFVATPITHRMPTQGEDYYVLTLNRQQIRVPAFLFSPAYRKVFDSFISKVYRLAMARARQEETTDLISTDPLVDAVKRESGIEIGTQKKTELSVTAMQMVLQLETLQRQGRNGIWHFIISNSYRPGMTEKQFNCIVSNPPWMAMSKLADNPYKNALREIARKYAIQPHGAAHPHMELATIFFGLVRLTVIFGMVDIGAISCLRA